MTAFGRARGKSGKRLNRSIAGDVFLLVFLLLIGVFMVLPFVYSLLMSLKPMEELYLFPPRFFVRRPTADNFFDLSKLVNNMWVPFGRYLLNSFMISVCVTVGNVLIASAAAFPLAKGNFPGRKAVSEIVVVALLFTSSVTGIMQYVLMAKAGMIDTFFPLVLPYISTPLGVFLMRQFMVSLPDSLIEAAKIDGAGYVTTWWRVVMPNVRPAWLTLTVFAFQTSWAVTGGNMIFSESLKPLPTLLNQIASSGIGRAGAGAAAAVIMMIPPILIFLFVQSNIIETMAHSGIKE